MKKILIVLTAVALGAGAFYAWNEYHRGHENIRTSAAAQQAEALTLIAAFEKDTAAAAKQYTGKIIAVSGTLKRLEGGGAPAVLQLGDPAQMSSVLCSMDTADRDGYNTLRAGKRVTLKGICAGYQHDELLGTDVNLSRCVIISNP